MSTPEVVDARGLLCPLPMIRTQDAVRLLPPGARLTVVASDPGTRQDIPAWCRVNGHELVSQAKLDTAPDGAPEYHFLIQVGAP